MIAGDRLWNGAIVSEQEANAYNAIHARIESFEREGKPVPEYLLNGRHNLFMSICGIVPRAACVNTIKA